jgi:hypothetical protein
MSRDPSEETWLSPDKAFSALGNETRIDILQTLGAAEGPVTFSELRNRVGIRQGGQFNYHLDQLVGHFVDKGEAGYALREPGRRVVEAILSGAVTEDPVLEPTTIDFTCHHCDAEVVVNYDEGTMRMSCSECPGHFDPSNVPGEAGYPRDGTLANYRLPPAGVQGRSAEEVMRAAATWGHLSSIALACGVCPRCSAAVEQDVDVCDDHESGDGKCGTCDSRFAVMIDSNCTICSFDARSSAVMLALPVPEMLVFVGKHGLNTTSRGIEWGWEFEEQVLSTDPFEAKFTFTIEDDSITLTVDDDLEAVPVTH